MNHRVWGALVAVLTVSGPLPAFAGGFEVPDQSAAAGATGGAATARRGDPSSAWYNPAELADGRGFRGGLGLLLALPGITGTHLEGTRETASTELAPSTPPHLHLSYAWDAWAVGAYVGTSHGTSLTWPEGWWGRFESSSTGLLSVRMNPFASLRLGGRGGLIEGAPDLRLSIGLHVDIARLDSQRALDFIDEEGSVHLRLAGAGVGGDAAVYWQATEELALGLTYKSQTWMRLEGDADFTVPDPFVGRAPDQGAASELTIPDRLTLGAAWQQPEFAVFFDAGLTFWSVRKTLIVDFEDDATDDVATPQRWREAAVFRLGGRITVLPELQLRAGLFYDMEVGPTETLAPGSPDMARLGGTLGVGVDVTDAFGFDAYYGYTRLLSRASTSLDAPLASYEGDLHLAGVTVRIALASEERGANDSSAPAPPASRQAPVNADEPPEESE